MLAAQMVTTHTLAMRFLGSTSQARYPNPAEPEPNRHRKLSAVSSQQSEITTVLLVVGGNVIMMPEWD